MVALFPLRARLLALTAPLLLAAGCASIPSDRGQGELRLLLAARERAAADLSGRHDPDALAAALRQPLGPDDAVALAWRESPRVHAALAELGLAGADLFESGRLRNPTLSASRIGGGDGKTTVAISAVVSDLLTLPARGRIGAARWQGAIAMAGRTLLEEAAHTRADWYRYVAAIQIAQLRAAAAEAAVVSAELADRLHAAGNLSQLQLAQAQAAATRARAEATQARVQRLERRMALAERLGLAGRSNAWQTLTALPLPPETPIDLASLLAQAHAQRPDLAAARLALAAERDGAELARRFAWLGEVELGYEREREDGRRESGPTLALELPLFQQGQAGRARGQALHALAQSRLQQHELALERQVRTGSARLQGLATIVGEYRRSLLPQHATVFEREQERYNFMLIGAFELIQARRAQFDAHQAYLEAIRDWWLARVELQLAVAGPLPGDDAVLQPAPGLDQLLAPAAGGHDQHRHHAPGPAAAEAAPDADPHRHHRAPAAAAPESDRHRDHRPPPAADPDSDPHRQHRMPAAVDDARTPVPAAEDESP
jgi:cobalt-zinc-cadmium efflux system outer membrane protein